MKRGAAALNLLNNLGGGGVPDEWLGIVLPPGDPQLDGGDEIGDAGEDATAKAVVCELLEPSVPRGSPMNSTSAFGNEPNRTSAVYQHAASKSRRRQPRWGRTRPAASPLPLCRAATPSDVKTRVGPLAFLSALRRSLLGPGRRAVPCSRWNSAIQSAPFRSQPERARQRPATDSTARTGGI